VEGFVKDKTLKACTNRDDESWGTLVKQGRAKEEQNWTVGSIFELP